MLCLRPWIGRKRCPGCKPVPATSRRTATSTEMESIWIPGGCGGRRSTQLKATALSDSADGHYRFALKRRNYDLLREETQTPRLLVVLELPSDEDRWITITADSSYCGGEPTG